MVAEAMTPPAAVPSGASARPTLLSRLSSSCLRFLAEHDGASGSGVRDGLGVRHLSQASRLLARLERDGLLEKQSRGRENHWHLTARGQEVLHEQDPIWSVEDDIVVRPRVETNPSKGARTW
jgi:DNA-binding MarR family transcriptional regulator